MEPWNPNGYYVYEIKCVFRGAGGENANSTSGFGKSEERSAKVARSQSMKKPFQKIGDGFLKTFLNLKKK